MKIFKQAVKKIESMVRSFLLLSMMFLAVGLLAGCGTTFNYSTKPLYSIIEHERETVAGKFKTREIIIYQTSIWSLGGPRNITIERDDNVRSARFIYRVESTDWVFADTMEFNVNDKLFTLKPKETDKTRTVVSGNKIRELVYYDMPVELLIELLNAKFIKISVAGVYSIINIDEEGLQKIKDFLKVNTETDDAAKQ